MTTIKDILLAKGTHVHTILESATVLEAVKQMNTHRVGCLVVMSEDAMVVGIVAERDVLQLLASEQQDLSLIPVSKMMTRNAIVCSPDDCLDTARVIMKQYWVRQIPVIDRDGTLRGIVSIGDVNALSLTEDTTEIKYLHDYIHGGVR
jgi:CBS domain-containing protein